MNRDHFLSEENLLWLGGLADFDLPQEDQRRSISLALSFPNLVTSKPNLVSSKANLVSSKVNLMGC